jgi:serine/threonine protein kinase
MFCGKCGNENVEGVKFCVKCGADISRLTPPPRDSGGDSLDGQGTGLASDWENEEFTVGSIFANRYEILTPGLRGGMGCVYKCRDTKLNETVALKLIHPRLIKSAQAISRFRQEVSISRRLQHTGIVKVYNLEEYDGKEYFTMEWVEGKTLRQVIEERKRENRPFSLKEASRIMGQLCDALQSAHQETIHRDIKPENVLTIGSSSDMKVKLSDFGIAKMLSPSQFTSTSMQMGTPYYMAPEQKLDSANVDKRADIYALGVVLFELLTLENTIGLEMPSEINKSLPKEIDQVIKKAVVTKPQDRYGDAQELSDALKAVVTNIDNSELRRQEEEVGKEKEKIRQQEEEQRRKADDERKRIEEETTARQRAEENSRRLAEEQKRREQEEQQNREQAETQRKAEEERKKQEEINRQREKEQKNKGFNFGFLAIAIVIIGAFFYFLVCGKKQYVEQRPPEPQRLTMQDNKPKESTPVQHHSLTLSPSFDCKKATTYSERLICSDENLCRLDLQMASLFRKARKKITDREAFKNEQIYWLKNQRDVCTDVESMSKAYQMRIEQLSNY